MLITPGFSYIASGYNKYDNAIYIHTNDDNDEGANGHGYQVWSQQAKLVPEEEGRTNVPASGSNEGDQFGYWMVSYNQTIIVGSPTYKRGNLEKAGAVYIFNGSLREWTQVQKLVLPDTEVRQGDTFGERIAFDELFHNRIVIGASNADEKDGAAYVFERENNAVYWSRTTKLVAQDPNADRAKGIRCGQSLSTFAEHVVMGCTNYRDPDAERDPRGLAYVFSTVRYDADINFKSFIGTWSQQQKLVADDLSEDWDNPVVGSKIRRFAYDLEIFEGRLVASTNRPDDVEEENIDGVYVFSEGPTSRWTLQQKLFVDDENTDDPRPNRKAVDIHMRNKTLVTTVGGADYAASYIFRTSDGTRWSQNQKIVHSDHGSEGNFSNPMIWGSTMLINGGETTEIYSQYRNDSCINIWMSDHFHDGWDTAVLSVIAPDLTNDTFQPLCNQIDPFNVRYCPYTWENGGLYTVKVYAPTRARYFWEINYQVTVEATGEIFKGDYSTKMIFDWSPEDMEFTFHAIENKFNMTNYLEGECYRCTRINQVTWMETISAKMSFFPLTVRNAHYYISDNEGYLVSQSGKVCEGAMVYECYIIVKDGTYHLRLGGGMFGEMSDTILGVFPQPQAIWSGCGAEGTYLDQLTFEVKNGVCTPLFITTYPNNTMVDRCRSNTQAPTFAPTPSPTVQNIDPNWQRRLEMSQGDAASSMKGKITKVYPGSTPGVDNAVKNDGKFNEDKLFL